MNKDKKDEIPFPTGASVPFPYEAPYPQQVHLMDAMLSSLQNNECNENRVMLLESPTGTGKSLSLACAAMTWLRYQQECDLNIE